MAVAANTYDVGDEVRLSAAFEKPANTPADPGTIVFKVKDPSGNITTYTYGSDAQLVKDSTGNYHVDVTIDEEGTWFYRFTGTGTVVAAGESFFYARESHFS